MDWKEFVSSLVGSLAWPMVAVLALVLFRGSIGGLLKGSLRRLSVGPGGAELEWHDAVGETAVEAVSAAVSSRSEPDDDEYSELVALVEKDPAAAVMKSYGSLWLTLRQAAGDPPKASGRQVVHAAQSQGLITDKTAKALDGLLVLRNLAAHRPEDVTKERAADYIAMSAAVRYALDHDLGNAV